MNVSDIGVTAISPTTATPRETAAPRPAESVKLVEEKTPMHDRAEDDVHQAKTFSVVEMRRDVGYQSTGDSLNASAERVVAPATETAAKIRGYGDIVDIRV